MNFITGQEYERPSLLDFVGSAQQQTGIIWGAKQPRCVIITTGGRHGKNAGYNDLQNPDGTWTYIGQGSKGNQNPAKFSNSLLVDGERDVLLFTTREPTAKEIKENGHGGKKYRFQGIFQVVSWELKKATAGDRKDDHLIHFLLIETQNVFDKLELYISKSQPSHNQKGYFKEKLKDLGNNLTNKVKQKQSVTEYLYRSALVKDYALYRANGICELCTKPAPFITSLKMPFLEVHHILRLSDDGPDLPINVAAVCPNCHREAHFGINHEEIKIKLMKIIEEKEKVFWG
ncbi:HNH endonuclease [Mucilaginibacter gossypii]|nr:HNH endonuclease signature motif containing protein [Mucilaginibacter gossypii]